MSVYKLKYFVRSYSLSRQDSRTVQRIKTGYVWPAVCQFDMHNFGVMEPFYDIPGFHMWRAKVRSVTVGKNSHCVVKTPWLAEQCRLLQHKCRHKDGEMLATLPRCVTVRAGEENVNNLSFISSVLSRFLFSHPIFLLCVLPVFPFLFYSLIFCHAISSFLHFVQLWSIERHYQ